MRDSVKAAFKTFSTKFEGYLPFMYADVKGLVTTGMGNLIDPVDYALSLPWRNSDGSLASQEQIRSAWQAVKDRTDLTQRGGGAYKSVTSIRLDDAGITQLINGKMSQNEAILKKRFPGWDAWPADAQLAIHSMSWALGPNFKYPKFIAAVNQLVPDFVTAAKESHIGTAGNPGIIPRNAANEQLFLNADHILKNHLDPDDLLYDVGVSAAQNAAAALSRKSTVGARMKGGARVGAFVAGAAVAVVAGSEAVKWYQNRVPKTKRSGR